MSLAPEQQPKIPRTLAGRILKGLAAVPLAIWVFSEEIIWNNIAKAMAALGRLPVIRSVEKLISRSPPYVALILFAVPGLIMLAAFAVAKLIGTALLARIFNLTKPQLMTIGWFAWIYERFIRWKTRLFDYVKATPTYQRARLAVQTMKQWMRTQWRAVFHKT
jgi:hypothetical protein